MQEVEFLWKEYLSEHSKQFEDIDEQSSRPHPKSLAQLVVEDLNEYKIKLIKEQTKIMEIYAKV